MPLQAEQGGDDGGDRNTGNSTASVAPRKQGRPKGSKSFEFPADNSVQQDVDLTSPQAQAIMKEIRSEIYYLRKLLKGTKDLRIRSEDNLRAAQDNMARTGHVVPQPTRPSNRVVSKAKR